MKLTWEGYIDVDTKKRRLERLIAVALGNEKLRWGNKGLLLTDEPDVAHLPAGHPIDLKCGVRYGLVAEPCAEDEADDGRNQSRPPRGQRPDVDRQIVDVLGPRFLALRTNVWKELKLSDDQRQSLTKARETEIEAFRKLMPALQDGRPQQRQQRIEEHRREATKRLNDTLTEVLENKQQSRLRQIGLQRQGLFAIGDPDVQQRLKLTDEQRRGFADIVRDLQRRFQSLQQQNRDDPRQLQQQLMKIRREQSEKIRGLLTDDQQRRWRELLGKRVNLDPQQTNKE